MKKRIIENKTGLDVNTSLQGETLEMKVERIVNNGEPIEDTAPMIYTERMSGVHPAHDVRTDRMEIAIEGMNNVSKTQIAKRVKLYAPTEESKEISGDPSQHKETNNN